MNEKPFNEVLADELDKRAEEINLYMINRFKDIPESDFTYYTKTCRKLKQQADKLRKLSKEVK